MITIISIFTILIFGAIILVSLLENDYKDIKKWKRNSFNLSLFVFAFGILVNMFTKDEFYFKKWSLPLENIKDNTFIYGKISLHLGSGEGEIKEEIKYNMYVKTSYGAKLIRLPLEKCKIIYSNKKEVETVLKAYKYPNDWRKYFIIRKNDELVIYNINIPRNSIDNNFKLDAE